MGKFLEKIGGIEGLSGITGGIAGIAQTAANAAEIKDTSEEQSYIDNLNNFVPDLNSFDAMQQLWQQNQFASTGYTAKDVRGMTDGQKAGSILGAGAQGAMLGTQIMPGWGTFIGAAAGTIVGGIGVGVGDAKSLERASQLNSDGMIANNRYMDKYEHNAKNIVTSTTNEALLNLAAFGGPLHTGNFNNGVMFITEGGSHEQNPYDGVQMGIAPDGKPNLVEEGEVIYNDYVYSKRLKVPKEDYDMLGLKGSKEYTFAEAAEIIQRESEERPNDPISKKNLETLFGRLQQSQETYKQKRDTEKMQQELASLSPEEQDYLLQSMAQQNPQSTHLYAGGGAKSYRVNPDAAASNFNRKSKKSGKSFIPERQLRKQLIDQFKLAHAEFKKAAEEAYLNGTHVEKPLWIHNGGVVGAYGYWNANTNTITGKRIQKWYDDDLNTWEHVNKFADLKNMSNRESDIPQLPIELFDVNLPTFKVTPPQIKNPTELDEVEVLGKVWPDLGKIDKFNPTLGTFTAKAPIIKLESTPEIIVDRDAMLTRDSNIPHLPIEKLEVPEPPFEVIPPIIKTPSKKEYRKYIRKPIKKEYGEYKKTIKMNPENPKNTHNNKAQILRAMPVFGNALGALFSAFDKPNYSNIQRTENQYQQIPTISARPIGNRMAYTPLDINYLMTQIGNQNIGNRRAIVESGAGNPGAVANALLASNYKGTTAMGDAFREADAYNLDKYHKVQDFNKNIDVYNTDNSIKALVYNQARASQIADAMYRTGILRDQELATLQNNRSTTLSNTFKSMGNLGKDMLNRQQALAVAQSAPVTWNTIMDMFAQNNYDGLLRQPQQTTEESEEQEDTITKAFGGKVSKRKKGGKHA